MATHRPGILFKNVYTSAGIACTNTNSAFPAANVLDWRPAGPYRWKGTSNTTWTFSGATGGYANCIAIAGHNLGTCGATVTVGGVGLGVVPSDRFWMKHLESSVNNPQVVITTGAAKLPEIGVMCVGTLMEFPHGIQPGMDPYGRDAVTDWTQNKGGAFLGSRARFVRNEVTLNYGDPGFTDSEFWQAASPFPSFDNDFIPHAARYPFFFNWDVGSMTEPVFGYASGPIHTPVINILSRRGLQMTISGYSDAL